MISKSLFEKAARKNLISVDQIDPLYDFISSELDHGQSEANISNTEVLPASREEPLKFVRSFGDVFITLGIIMLVLAINMTNVWGYYYFIPAVVFIGISEWLVRVRKLALPGIALLLAILYFIYRAVTFDVTHSTFFGFLLIGVCSLLFYLRYKMPFSLLPMAASTVAMFVTKIGFDVVLNPEILIGFGVVIFLVALWFDTRDTKRISHLSDNAFWLYLVAAPLIVHGVMVSMLLSNRPIFDVLNKEILIIVFFAAFFLLSLLIDRRAILISTQMYVIYALSKILYENLNNPQNIMIYIFIGLGLFVIYFGTYWYKTRRIIFGFLKDTAISRYIPDLDTSDVKKRV